MANGAVQATQLKIQFLVVKHSEVNKKSALSMAIIDGHIQVVDDLIKAKRCNTFVSTRGAGRCAS
eukprot:8404747-Pyramimonas_sp.AAC.1